MSMKETHSGMRSFFGKILNLVFYLTVLCIMNSEHAKDLQFIISFRKIYTTVLFSTL